MRKLHQVFFIIMVLVADCYAQTGGRDMQKEAAIWEQLQATAPELVDAFKEATAKMDRGDYLGAAVLYQKVVEAAPHFDAGWRRLGTCLVEAGESERGVAFLEKALKLNRSSANLSQLAVFLAYPGKDKHASREKQERALTLALEATAKDTQPDLGNTLLVAQLALALRN